MAELQYYPSVIQSGIPVLVNGVEVQNGDLALIGQTAGLADDRTLAELIRLIPTDGSHVARAILPTGSQPNTVVGAPGHNAFATVSPTGSGNGSVLISPFRAIVGSRGSVGTGALANYRDIRSCVFVGSVSALSQTFALAANASGNPRWDLIYAQMTVDAAANQVQRRVKDPNSSSPSVQTVYQYLAQTVQIAAAQGTPGASPVAPNLPADSGSTYNIPLALVLVPTGWGPTSTVVPEQLRDVALVASVSATLGGYTICPGNLNHDKVNPDGSITANGYASDATFAWTASSPYRSPLFLPPTMQGGQTRFFLIDLTNVSHPSVTNGATIDDSIDWRNRFFRVQAFVTADTAKLFASDPAAQALAAPAVPHPINVPSDGRLSFAMSQSFVPDGVITSASTVFRDGRGASNGLQTTDPFPSGGFVYGIVCDSSGHLTLWYSGTFPGCRFFIWLEATGQFPNYTTATP